jgi:5'(3')-deoxyribonucleotidase
MRQRIAVDMDDVIADTTQKRIDDYNDVFSRRLSKADFSGKRFVEGIPEEHRPWAEVQIREPDIFIDLPVITDSQEVLQHLSQDFDILIATAAMEIPTSFNAKFAWLERHFPFLDPHYFIFCGYKSIVKADFLIDDSPSQLELFSGTGVLYSQPKNIHEQRFSRVDSWQAVREYFS